MRVRPAVAQRSHEEHRPRLIVKEEPRGFGWIDALVLLAVMGLLWSALHFGRDMLVHFHPANEPPLDPSASQIPYSAGRTLLRMWIAFAFSLVFAVGVGYLAAKNRIARALILHALDVLQSVPVLGFLSATVTAFMALFPGSLLGVECAALFAIFTGQVWNMPSAQNDCARTADLARTLPRTTRWRKRTPAIPSERRAMRRLPGSDDLQVDPRQGQHGRRLRLSELAPLGLVTCTFPGVWRQDRNCASASPRNPTSCFNSVACLQVKPAPASDCPPRA